MVGVVLTKMRRILKEQSCNSVLFKKPIECSLTSYIYLIPADKLSSTLLAQP